MGAQMFESRLTGMLQAAIPFFEDQGVICEITSPTSISFSSTLPKSRVRDIFEASSVPIKPSFADAESGCRGDAVVQGVPRADE